jgi:hypothetical protein
LYGEETGDGKTIFLSFVFENLYEFVRVSSPNCEMRFLKDSVARSFFYWARSFTRDATTGDPLKAMDERK